jgi:signal transduction histidine kinase
MFGEVRRAVRPPIMPVAKVRKSDARRDRPIRPRTRPGEPQPPRRPGAGDRCVRDLVFSMQNGVVAITRDGRIAMMNQVASRILDREPCASDVGRPFGAVLGASSEVARILASAFALTHLPNRAELRLRSSGKVIGYTLSHVRDRRGRPYGAALFFKDLTRVEQLEERERLRDRLAALGEMAAAIAHEVKNPLAGIEVMAGVLRRQLTGSPDAQAVLNDIIHEAKVANAIVLEALEFVRPIRLQLEGVVVRELLNDALTLARSQAGGAAADVRLEVASGVPVIEGDAQQLRQLFINLLANAFEAIREGGRVRVAATPGPMHPPAAAGDAGEAVPTVMIDVADDGPGVPEEVKDRIFSPFFTTKPRGSGLGLAIVRKIVDAHDGRIDVMARPYGGTCFRVTLPTRPAQDALDR